MPELSKGSICRADFVENPDIIYANTVSMENKGREFTRMNQRTGTGSIVVSGDDHQYAAVFREGFDFFGDCPIKFLDGIFLKDWILFMRRHVHRLGMQVDKVVIFQKPVSRLHALGKIQAWTAGVQKFLEIHMRFDFHVHTTLSECGKLEISEILHHAGGFGLDGVCITDHDSMQIRKKLKEGVQKNGLFSDFRYGYSTTFVGFTSSLRAAEATRTPLQN